MIKSLLLVALGGAVGSSMRHLVSLGALRALGPNWPWGTMAVNVAGSLAMGALVTWLALRVDGGRDLRLLLGVGMLGGFTTFSAFSLETALMVERREWAAAGLYSVLSVTLCVAAVFAGMMIARRGFA
jgi:CrcB protein